MKTLKELRAERNDLIEKMAILVALGKDEKRALTEDENKAWGEHDVRIEAIDKEIKVLERQEVLNKQLLGNKPPKKSPEQKIAKRYDFFKAIRENFRGQLSGVELELSQEGEKEMRANNVVPMPHAFVIPSSVIRCGTQAELMQKRAEIGTGDTTPPIKTGAVDMLSIVRTPIVIDTIGGAGVTKYEGLTGNLKVPKMGQLVAAFVAEKSATATSGADLISDTLAPRRCGSFDYFTSELLSQTAMSIQAQILREFVDAIWRAVQVDVFDAVAAGATVISGSEITDAPAALTHALILSMESAIESGFPGMAYAMSNGQKALLKALVLDSGSGKFAWNDDNEVNGFQAVATAALLATNGGYTNTNFDVIFGNWRSAVVGSWGGIEVITDPYTASEKGEVKIAANGLFDTGVANALSFSALRNANL